MAGNRKGVYPTSGKRRKSYYEYSKDYPGTGYENNSKRSTSASMDVKKRIQFIFIVFLVIVVFILGYFITYTCLNISNEPIESPDDLINITDESTTLYIDDNDDSTTNENISLEQSTTVLNEK